MKTLVFGEILWDIIEGTPHLGGAPLNFAAHVVKCGHKSAIISALGRDERGDKALDLTGLLGVDISQVQRNDFPTGYVPVKVVGGQPQYTIVTDVAYDYIDIALIDKVFLNQIDTFYFGTLIQRSEVSRNSLYQILDHYRFDTVFYDVNLRKDCYSEETIRKSLGYCSVFKVNDEEVKILSEMLYGDSLDFIRFCEKIEEDWPNIHIILITAGKDGSHVYSDGNLVSLPAKKIKVADTVGAGDSFSAAFLSAFVRSGDAVSAARIATEVAGFVASMHGPIPEYTEELKLIVHKH